MKVDMMKLMTFAKISTRNKLNWISANITKPQYWLKFVEIEKNYHNQNIICVTF